MASVDGQEPFWMAMSRWGGEKEKEGVEEGEWVFTPSHHGRQPALKEERGGDAGRMRINQK